MSSCDPLERVRSPTNPSSPALTRYSVMSGSNVHSASVTNTTSKAASMPSHIHPAALWWALALGADFGGNLTAVGASANVVMIGIARRAGHPISFWQFTRKGALVTAMSIALSATYIWIRYFIVA